MDSVAFMRRDFTMTAFVNQSSLIQSDNPDLSKLTCNVAHDSNHILPQIDSILDFGSLEFEDLLGNPIDGRACDVVYTDDDEEVQLLVNPDGSVEYIWDVKDAEDLREAPGTSAEAHILTAEAARPSGILSSSLPERTSLSNDAVGSRITASPHSGDIRSHLRHSRP
jgi:hypothetical protein